VRIPIRVSLDQPEPMYHQIKTQLRALIMSGQLEQGTLLPSIRELANDLSCSVITIRRVYQDLETEGLLKTRQGTGTFVAHIEPTEKEKHKLEAVIHAMEEAINIARQHQYDDEEIQSLFLKCLMKREKED
jgi:GntR family transcriptional regulator